MQPPQNSTMTIGQTDDWNVPIPYLELNHTQQSIVDYKALNGLVTEPDEEKGGFKVRRMTVTELGENLGVTREAIYKSIDTIPNLQDLVNDRRKQLASETRLGNVHNTWYLMAVSGKSWQATEAYIRNFDQRKYIEPKQKVEHELGDGLADALQAARERGRDVIEGEIVDEPTQH